jgi:hypothetical protein
MPRVEGPADVTRCDPEVVLIERLPSETPADEHNADQLVERTGCALKDVEQHEQAIPAHDGGSAPARSGSLGAPCDRAAREQSARHCA